MNFQLLRNGDAIAFLETGIPGDHTGPLLPGGHFFSSEDDSAILHIQAINGEHYSLYYAAYRFFQKISLHARSAREGLYARFLLQNSVQHSIKGTGTVSLQQNEFTAIWSSAAECVSQFEKNKEYRIMDVYYSPFLLAELQEFFPQLHTLVSLSGASPVFTGKKIYSISAGLKKIITDILSCPYDASTSRFYFDLKAKELLCAIVHFVYKGADPRRKFHAAELKKIQFAHELLLKDIAQPPLTIRALAQQSNINEFALKKGFRELYQMSIFECLLAARMEKARELLLHTDLPIKAICSQAGYPRLSNFITAFRRIYGYTPGALRREG